MKRNVLGFFILFAFYLPILNKVFDIGLEMLALLPFYIFFILISSVVPSLYLAFVRAINSNLKSTVLLVNVIHILIVSIIICVSYLVVSVQGEITHGLGYLILIGSLIASVIILFREYERKWTWIMIIVLLLIIWSYSTFPGNVLEFMFAHKITSYYVVIHNVIVVSYIFLREKY